MKTLLGERIRELRLSRKWSKKHLFKLSGVDEKTILRIERGDTPRPHDDTLQLLANAFGINVPELQELRDREAYDTPETVTTTPNIDESVPAPAIPSNPTQFELAVSSRKKWKLSTKAVIGLLIAALLVFSIYALLINLRTQSNNAKPAIIVGKVLCPNNEPVVDIWVDVFKDGKIDKDISGLADLRTPNSNGSEVGFVKVLKGDAYNLHVGCGGSSQHWKGVYMTELGSGPVRDHTVHDFICHDVPPATDYGSCELQY